MADELVTLNLGDCVIQRRFDGLLREASPDLLEAERTGEIPLDPDDWWAADEARGALHSGQRFVWGHVLDGIPKKVMVGGQTEEVVVADPLWGCHWNRGHQRVEITFNDRVETLRLDRPPGFLRSPDEADQSTGGGWFGGRPDNEA
jgi:hypothetical protein